MGALTHPGQLAASSPPQQAPELPHVVLLSVAKGGGWVAPAPCTAWSLPYAVRNANYPTDSDLLLQVAHIGLCEMRWAWLQPLHPGTSCKGVTLLQPSCLLWPEMRLDHFLI